MEPLTFEQFMARKGLSSDADVQMHIHAGMRSAPESKSYKRWHAARLLELQRKRDAERSQAWAMYSAGVDSGLYREPTRLERLTRTAQGHDDNPSVQAARRLLAKMSA